MPMSIGKRESEIPIIDSYKRLHKLNAPHPLLNPFIEYNIMYLPNVKVTCNYLSDLYGTGNISVIDFDYLSISANYNFHMPFLLIHTSSNCKYFSISSRIHFN